MSTEFEEIKKGLLEAIEHAEGRSPKTLISSKRKILLDNLKGELMSKIKLRKWDSAEHLKTEEDMALYLEACFQEAGDDALFIAKALGNIARAKGMSQLSRDTGLGRESLYKALSGEGNPSFATILKVTTALGIKLHAQSMQTAIT
jgi:probable addiction module antidote protein